MNAKIVILGSTGMLGHKVVNYLDEHTKYNICNIAYRTKLNENTILVNARKEEELIQTIKELNPAIIINCMGVLISGADKDPENAIYINSYIPQRLKRLADDISAKLIHISTDCVFSGEKGKYIENDEQDGKDIYAKTKSLGEINDGKHLTIRTSIIGPELKKSGEGLFHWFMSQEGEINGFTQSVWSGVTTLELAKAIKWVIENDIVGLYHITNNEVINKYELLCLFKKATKKKIAIKPVPGKKVDKSLIDTRKEINYIIPRYEDMISEMISSIKKSKELYSRYNIS